MLTLFRLSAWNCSSRVVLMRTTRTVVRGFYDVDQVLARGGNFYVDGEIIHMECASACRSDRHKSTFCFSSTYQVIPGMIRRMMCCSW